MFADIDFNGIGVAIAALGAAIASIIGALNHRNSTAIRAAVDTNGDSRTLGQMTTDVAAQVAPDVPPADPAPPAH